MQNCCSKISQLRCFVIGQEWDGISSHHKPGIAGQDTIHIFPDLYLFQPQGRADHRGSEIASTSSQCGDCSTLLATSQEPGDDGQVRFYILLGFQCLCDVGVGLRKDVCVSEIVRGDESKLPCIELLGFDSHAIKVTSEDAGGHPFSEGNKLVSCSWREFIHEHDPGEQLHQFVHEQVHFSADCPVHAQLVARVPVQPHDFFDGVQVFHVSHFFVG
mmetsp:Transcript_4427/g.28232  ORF Transcript_4427/g.28232 Transcript_4427/m.28232 type:complete len:216 (+) Transcript_4427:1537-2184(+)